MPEEIRGVTKGSLAAYYAALGKVDEDRKKKGLKPIASKFAMVQVPYAVAGRRYGKHLAVPGGSPDRRPGAWRVKDPDKPPPTRHWAFDIKGAMRSHRNAFKSSARFAFPRRRHTMRRGLNFGKL